VDTNKNLVKAALDLIKMVADDMGKDVSKHLGKVFGGVCAALGDAKSHIKTAAQACLMSLVEHSSVNSSIKYIAKALMNAKAISSRELCLECTLACSTKELEAKTKIDWGDLTPALVECMQDKNVKVRKHAEALLVQVVQCDGFRKVKNCTENLSKAALNGISGTMANLLKVPYTTDT
jgi:hypothetical protein